MDTMRRFEHVVVIFVMLTTSQVGGYQGARAIAEELARRLGPGIEKPIEFILDEGMMILKGALPGLKSPVAFIGNSEKGAINLQCTVSVCPEGHSSMPPSATNVGATHIPLKSVT